MKIKVDVEMPLAELCRQLTSSDVWGRRWTKEEADQIWNLRMEMESHTPNTKHHLEWSRAEIETAFGCRPHDVLKAIEAAIDENDAHDEWQRNPKALAKWMRRLADKLEFEPLK